MQAYRTVTKVGKGQRILLERVPFEEGSHVEVIILELPVQGDKNFSLQAAMREMEEEDVPNYTITDLKKF